MQDYLEELLEDASCLADAEQDEFLDECVDV